MCEGSSMFLAGTDSYPVAKLYTLLLKDGSEFIDSIDVSFNFVHLCVSETKLIVSCTPYNGFEAIHCTQQPSLFIMFNFIKQHALKPFCVDFVCNMKMLFELKKIS